MIELAANKAAAGVEGSRAWMFRILAERTRSRFDPEEAEIVASWFDRLAQGEKAEDVFPGKAAGRPRGATAKRKPMRDGRVPDDFDIALIVKQNIGSGSVEEICKAVAKHFGIGSWRTVQNIWNRLKNELA